MNRILAGIIGPLAAAIVIAPAAIADNHSPSDSSASSPYTPFGLVRAAYNGDLPDVPSFGDFEALASTMRIDAEDLIRAAISQGRLTPEYLENRRYVNAVNSILDEM